MGVLKVSVLTTLLLLLSDWSTRGQTSEQHLWISDPDHSSIQFRARHWGIVDVIGWFEEFSVQLRAGPGFEDASVDVEVTLDSIRMPNPGMADNVRNLIFETEQFPTAVFRSTSIRPSEPQKYVVIGDLTIRDITKETTLRAQFNGFGIPPLQSPGFTVEGSLKLSEFGVVQPDDALENSRPTIDDVVHFTFNMRLEYTYEQGAP